LRETKAPIGYFLLGQDIILTVGAATGDGAVGSGATAGVAISLAESGNTNMWTITKTSDPDPVYEIKFKNTKLYALPESGSSGTYLFTISGVAVLMTALLLFIRSKKKEEGGYLKI
ncbi:MAG: LPXTG cell wall anchor domain-containing protein, partial [Eubacteriales bacterium]|nr:LPXTG cell wall anchor domain-containing protein [Eubacteriales bacterium]